MTAIAAIVHNGKVWMGADSAGVGGGYSLTIRSDPKIFKVGNFLIGFTSSYRMGQILRFFMTVPKQKREEKDFEYMVKTFVPSVQKALKDNGYLETNNGKEKIGTFLVGYHGNLYKICDDLQIGQSASLFDSCGCGESLCLGSLHTTNTINGMSPRKRILSSLQAAEALNCGVRAPFIVEQI